MQAVLACRYRDNPNGPIGIILLYEGTGYTRWPSRPEVVPLHFVATAPRTTIRIDPSIPASLRYNGFPSGFVILSSSSIGQSGMMPTCGYPNELWNSRSRAFNFPNLDPSDSAQYKHFALALSAGKQSATFLLGL